MPRPFFYRAAHRNLTRNLKPYAVSLRRYGIAAFIGLLIGAVGAGGYITHLQMQLGERQQLEALNVSITPAEAREGNRATFLTRAPRKFWSRPRRCLGP